MAGADSYDHAVVHLRLVVPPDLVEPGARRAARDGVGLRDRPPARRRRAPGRRSRHVRGGARGREHRRRRPLQPRPRRGRARSSLESVDTAVSETARRAERVAAGSPADAVVWEEVEARTSEGTELSGSFLAFMVLATMIAGVGILTDSIVLIIGAMVVGPEFGPLAALCVALVQRRTATSPGARASRSSSGSRSRSAPTFAATLLFRGDRRRRRTSARDHPETLFISDPTLVLGRRRAPRRDRRDALAHDGEVRRARGRAHLGDDDPGGGERRRRRGLRGVARGRGRGQPAAHQPRRRSRSPASARSSSSGGRTRAAANGTGEHRAPARDAARGRDVEGEPRRLPHASSRGWRRSAG